MSFLSGCSPCFKSCFKELTYKMANEKTETKESTHGTYERIKTPAKEHRKNGKSDRQPLLGGEGGSPLKRHFSADAARQVTPVSQQSALEVELGSFKPSLSCDQLHPLAMPSPKKKPYFEVNEELPEDLKSCPILQFSVLYDCQSRSLIINLQEAFNLPVDGKRGCNPFVSLLQFPNSDRTFMTEVLHNTTNPKWDMSFQFPQQTLDVLQKQTLVIRLYNRQEESHNIFIGMVTLPLRDADLYGPPVRMVIKKEGAELSIDSTGGLQLSLEYSPDKGLLRGWVLIAHNLKKREHFQRDPYVKLNLLYKGERLYKWKTSIKKNTLLPKFNEAFTFNIAGLDVSEITLQALVMDHSTIGKDEHLGTVPIGGEVDQKSGRMHWALVLTSPNESVNLWHVIIPPGVSGPFDTIEQVVSSF